MERKHRTQMSQTEIVEVERMIHSINEWDLTRDHADKRMAEKNVGKSDIVATLRYGAVIEVKDNGRLLFRQRGMNGKMKSTCVVVDLRYHNVVTVWRNDGTDNHKTLVASEYTWKGDAVTLVRSLCSPIA